MGPLEQRIAVNEALFRDVNKNIYRASSGGRLDEPHFLCECGDRGCEDKVSLPVDTYEAIRSNPLRFFVKPGHDIPRTEAVVERHQHYLVIEKPPEARPIIDENS